MCGSCKTKWPENGKPVIDPMIYWKILQKFMNFQLRYVIPDISFWSVFRINYVNKESRRWSNEVGF